MGDKNYPEHFSNGMSNIFDISEGIPHKVSEVICVKCGKRWIAVRPEKTLLKDLKCPKHHVGFVIETGEEIVDSL